MTELRDRYIRFDWAIKRLLRQKANFGVLEGFLTVFLNEPIKIVDILESEGNQQQANDKFNRVDIKAKNSKGEIIIVEIQNTSELYYLERVLYGVAKAITEHINLGNTYKEVKKVYSISILYFDLGKGSDYIYVGQNNFVGLHTQDHLVISTKEKDTIVRKSPSEIFPTYILVRVNEFNKVAKSPLEEWVEYLKNGVISPETQAPGLQEAREKLKYYSMSDAERYAYDEHINAIMIQNDVLGNARVLEKPLSKVYTEIDVVTTPSGKDVAMVHCNNCTSDINAWIGLLRETLGLFGCDVSAGEVFTKLYQKSLEGEADCGGVLVYNYMAGEGITHLDAGRPLVVRRPDSRFSLANFMRSSVYAEIATMRLGMDILAEEQVKIDSMTGHGGIFKTPGVAQRYLAAACNASITCMETAGEGGPYGIALLAAFMDEHQLPLEEFLRQRVFVSAKITTAQPDPAEVEGFARYLAAYDKGLDVERTAVEKI